MVYTKNKDKKPPFCLLRRVNWSYFLKACLLKLPIAFSKLANSEPPPEVGKVLMISVVPFDSVQAIAESFEDGVKSGSSSMISSSSSMLFCCSSSIVSWGLSLFGDLKKYSKKYILKKIISVFFTTFWKRFSKKCSRFSTSY